MYPNQVPYNNPSVNNNPNIWNNMNNRQPHILPPVDASGYYEFNPRIPHPTPVMNHQPPPLNYRAPHNPALTYRPEAAHSRQEYNRPSGSSTSNRFVNGLQSYSNQSSGYRPSTNSSSTGGNSGSSTAHRTYSHYSSTSASHSSSRSGSSSNNSSLNITAVRIDSSPAAVIKKQNEIKEAERKSAEYRKEIDNHKKEIDALQRKLDASETSIKRMKSELDGIRAVQASRSTSASGSAAIYSAIPGPKEMSVTITRQPVVGDAGALRIPAGPTLIKFKPLTLRFKVIQDFVTHEMFIPEKRYIRSFTFQGCRSFCSPDKPMKILLRCCVLDRKASVQQDYITAKLDVTVNKQLVYGTGKKAPLRGPLDITKFCGDYNCIEIQIPDKKDQLGVIDYLDITKAEIGVNVVLVEKMEFQSSIQLLKTDPKYKRSEETTKRLIRSKFTENSECGVTDVQISLIDPLSKTQIKLPCFGIECPHMIFFDGDSFIELNRDKEAWKCPVCQKPIGFDEMRVDELLLKILSECKPNIEKVAFDQDGNWKIVEQQVEPQQKESSRSNPTTLEGNSPEIVCLDSSEDEAPPARSTICTTIAIRAPEPPAHQSPDSSAPFDALLNTRGDDASDSSDIITRKKTQKRRQVSRESSDDSESDGDWSTPSSAATKEASSSSNDDSEDDYAPKKKTSKTRGKKSYKPGPKSKKKVATRKKR